MITVKDLVDTFGLEVLNEADLDRPVEDGYVSDILSDVMANAPKRCIWLTHQAHENILATAFFKSMAAILLIGPLEGCGDLKTKAEQKKINVLHSDRSSFKLVGDMYALGVGKHEEE